MSTIFAVRKMGVTTQVAHRFALPYPKGVGITWLTKNEYPDNTKVFPLDNSDNGVKTIGDLKKLSINGKL